MIDRTEDRFGLKPPHLAADSAYASAANLAWLSRNGRSRRIFGVRQIQPDGTFSRVDFTFDPRDEPIHLPRRQTAGAVPAQLHDTSDGDHQCRHAALPRKPTRLRSLRAKAAMLPHMAFRKIRRDLHEMPAMWPEPSPTPEYERSRHRRKKVDHLAAWTPRLRGPSGARNEFLLAATAQNLRKLAKLRPMTAAMP
ncbi:hypothetical protein [Mesorhizobium sp. WSM2239]|uniref:Transposase DDE domain-containing protein n=2 Tax=unclassified Mesorhizobium TaxID=325217 RepID=A0AAU8DCG7_9HYPH